MVDFLKRQVHALRESAKLFFLIAAATLGTVLLNGIVVGYLVAAYLELESEGKVEELSVFLYGSLAGVIASFAIVGVGFIYSLMKARHGGVGVAEALGGKLLSEIPSTPALLRLRNVAEEMAIAYSLPMPALYVLEGQRGINAFAAGFTPQSAVIGVTEGCVELLNRDQLQGVIAHEFSHVYYGDMRLNMQLTSIVNGLRSITLVGDALIDTGRMELEHARWNSHRQHKRAGGGYALIVLGSAMWVVGLVGSSFASLLVLAVSRQREFLADARAVQATRNPRGLADALRRIAGLQVGGRIRISAAREVSHLMFSQACGRSSDIFATHPPLATRILALDPTWDRTPLFESYEELSEYNGAFGEAIASIGGIGLAAGTPSRPNSRPNETANQSEVALPVAVHTREVAATDENIDPALAGFVADPLVIHCSLPMLMFWDHPQRSIVEAIFKSGKQAEILLAIEQLLSTHDQLTRSRLLNITLRALRRATTSEKTATLDNVAILASQTSDQDWDSLAWLWLARYYAGAEQIPQSKPLHGQIDQLVEPILEVLSVASQIDGGEAMSEFSFQRGWTQLGLEHATSLPSDVLHWQEVLAAIRTLACASPRIKRDLLVALGCTFTGDGELSHGEIAFLRLVRLHLGAEDTDLLAAPRTQKKQCLASTC